MSTGFAAWPPTGQDRRYTGPLARHRRKTVIGALIAVVLVIAGIVAWAPWDAAPPTPDTAPFFVAVYNLSTQPMVQYSGGSADGTNWSMTVTGDGERMGTITADGQQVPVLTVHGETYFKLPREMIDKLPTSVPQSSLESQWLTGDNNLLETIPSELASPSSLAGDLLAQLVKVKSFPQVGAQTRQVDGISALQVKVPDGVLSVSATAPYRVLSLEPSTSTGSSGTTTVTAWNSASAPSGTAQINVAPVNAASADQAYKQLVDQTKTLTSAVNIGVQFNFNHTGNLNCSDSSCVVAEDVTTTASSNPGASLSGTVTADMAANVTVDGQPAGSCTQTASLPLNGAGTMTCTDAGVAPIISSIKAREQQQADEEAAANPGQEISMPYTISTAAEVSIEAMADATAEVDQEVSAEQAEQQSADQAEKSIAGSCAADYLGAAAFTGRPLALTALVKPDRAAEADASDCSDEAWEIAKHALARAKSGGRSGVSHIIPGVDLTEEAYAEYADAVMDRKNIRMGYRASDDSTAYWDSYKNAIVIVSTRGQSTMFVPDDGYTYFTDNFDPISGTGSQ